MKGIWKNKEGFAEETVLGLEIDPEDYLKVIQIGPDAQLGTEKPTMTVLKSPDKKKQMKENGCGNCKTNHPPGILLLSKVILDTQTGQAQGNTSHMCKHLNLYSEENDSRK